MQELRISVLLVAVFMLSSVPMYSDSRGSIHGKVWDPSGAVIVDAVVKAKNIINGQESIGRTNNEGEYELSFVQAGHYQVTAQATGFQPALRYAIVAAGQRVEMNFNLVLSAAPAVEVSVADTPADVEFRSTSVQSSFDATSVNRLAGASESVAGLEAYTGTAWRSQEHLHIRGAHQVNYQVNGIAIPDLSSFEPLTPFIDPRNMKFVEVTTGGLLPEYGNRTAAVVNTITRSGFDEGEHGRIETSVGNLGRESLFANFGDHVSDKFAYYFQGTALASRRGLNPAPDQLTIPQILDRPENQTRHNFRRTFQNFANFEWRPDENDAVNIVLAGFRSDFQIPNTIAQQIAGRDYVQFERDHFQNVQWRRTLSPHQLLTISAYHHFNKLEINGRGDGSGLPLASDNRRANYLGTQAEWSATGGQHLVKLGYGIYATRVRDDFSILPNAISNDFEQAFYSRVPANAWQNSVYFQDQFDATDQLTVNYGGRLDSFSVRYRLSQHPNIQRRDFFVSPRLGLAYKFADHDTVIFASSAWLFLPPPLEYFEFPSGTDIKQSRFQEGFSFTPVLPEKDIQYDVGIRFRLNGYRVRVTQWFKRQSLFLDHVQLAQLNGYGELINPNIFLPVNINRARARGVETFVEMPAYRSLHSYINYSFGYAQGRGGVVHGFNDGSAAEPDYFFLDHDQRHQLYVGADYNIERWRAFVSGNYVFGSAFPDASDAIFGQCVTRNCRLPSHSTVNLTVGKKLNQTTDARLEIENLTNKVYPINLGSEFNGSHVSMPRVMTLRLAYHF
jgi:outer membrane receptor protein involved in Fe transport